MFTTVLISDHERGLRYRNGRVVAFLEPGRHFVWFPGPGNRIERLDVSSGLTPWRPELAVVPPDAARVVDVPFRSVGVARVDGIPTTALTAGRWLAWNAGRAVDVAVYGTEALATTLPEPYWRLFPPTILQEVVVLPHERVLVYADGPLDRVLGPGRHGLHVEGRTVAPVRVDLREQELQIAGQELMTADKVSLRVTLLVRYRVEDPVKLLSEVQNVRDGLYAVAQLAARQSVASRTLEALLEARNDVATELVAAVTERLRGWGVALVSLDLKDLVLPGDMRALLNQVIEAEKRAAANVILRREETAATRSLANTAKLLEQNPMLLRLKELESMERMAEKVAQLTVVATPGEVLRTLALPGA